MKWSLILIILLILGKNAFAHLINQCGIYQVEGYYTLDLNKRPIILLNHGTRSEIKVLIKNPNVDKLIPKTHLGVNFKLKLNFLEACSFSCNGEIVEIINPLDPFTKPRSFESPFTILQKKECSR